MTAAEEYTAHHSESLDTILHKWGWRRFERMFRLHLLRKAREELRELRDLRLAALDANMNYDSEENRKIKEDKANALRDIYNACVKAIYSPAEPVEDQMEEDPLFAPISRRANEMRQEINRPLAPQAGMGQQLLEATS
jgi:hypothetical protein